MSEEISQCDDISRRSVLQRTGAGAIGAGMSLNGILGTVSAEDATREDVRRLENASSVRMILDELGINSLPGPGLIDKRHADDNGELTNGELDAWKVPIRNYGTLTAMEFDGKIGAIFTFDSDTPKVPNGFSMAREENAALGVSGSEVVFSRNATEEERKSVLSALDVGDDVEGANVEAKTLLDGFHVSITINDAENGRDMREFVVEVDEFDPREQELADAIDDPSSLSTSGPEVSEVGVQFIGPINGPIDILKDVVLDWVVGTIASEGLDYLGRECNTTCPDCVMYIIDVVGTCRNCVPLCSSGATGVGAIACVACFYLFCNNAESQVDCLACLVCLVEGEEPETMDTNALRWVLDEIRDIPSFPL